MKVIKITATAHRDLEVKRAGALPSKRDPLTPSWYEPDEYDRAREKGDAALLALIDRVLGDTGLWEKSLSEPVNVSPVWPEYTRLLHGKWQLFLFQDCLYDVTGEIREDQRVLLVQEAADKERQHFERLKAKFSSPEAKKPKRERIPEDVRITVWQRDMGKCSRCSSNEKLEYDHIIPVSLGGSNTARNVELLCEACNRKKHANIQ